MSEQRTTTQEAESSLYRDLVVERARRPLHGGVLDPADGFADGSNPLCGDKVQVGMRLGDDGDIVEIRHNTRGCAICAASADLMAEIVHGRTSRQAEKLRTQFEELLTLGETMLTPAARSELGPLLAFADLHDYKSRRKCATLPWSALLAAFKSSEDV